MKIILSLLVSLGIAAGMYVIVIRETTKTLGGSPATATATVTVQMQLTNLAQAERMYFVQNNAYATLEQLSASGNFTLPNSDPNGYVYSVDVTPGGFTATAQHAPGAAQSAANFPVFSIDQTMSMHKGDAQAGGASQAAAAPPVANTAGSADPGAGAAANAAVNAASGATKSDEIPSFPTPLPTLPSNLAGAGAQPQN